MTFTVVQHGDSSSTGTATLSSCVSGNGIACIIGTKDGTTPATPTGYAAAGTPTHALGGTGIGLGVFYKTTSGGAESVTPAVDTYACGLIEIAAPTVSTPVDQATYNISGASSVTTLVANDILLAAAGGSTVTTLAGFTDVWGGTFTGHTAGGTLVRVFYEVVSATGTYSSQSGGASGNFCTSIVGFSGFVAAPAAVSRPLIISQAVKRASYY